MNFDKLEQFLNHFPKCGIPACELAVTKNGDLIFRHSVGYANLETGKKASPSDLYWIFSATKVITCTAAMRLVEENRISLDDCVSKYLPEYETMYVQTKGNTRVPCREKLRIEHLFTMTGGFDYDLKDPAILEAVRNPEAKTVEIVRAMAKKTLLFEPGTHYRYSLCHDILAAVVEVVSGMRFSEYLQKNIFDPLQMRDTGFDPSPEQLARFSDMYRHRVHNGTATKIDLQNPYRLSKMFESGGAGLFSSVDDYIKFVTVLALGGTSKDGYRLLKPETIALMEQNRLTDDALKDFVTQRLFGYGWGLCGRVHINPAYSLSKSPVGEFGWDGAAGAFTMVDTENQIALYFGMHILGCTFVYNVLHPQIRNLVYESIFEN